MNQVATKKEGALSTNLFEADANQGAQTWTNLGQYFSQNNK